MNIKLLKWSRLLHKWIGVYIAVLTVVWLGELILLPVIHAPAFGEVSGRTGTGSGRVLDARELLARFEAGVYGPPRGSAEILYQPEKGVYVILDKEGFRRIRVDADSGEFLGGELDQETLFREKTVLGWIHPVLSGILKAPFEVCFILLAATGLHLVLFPYVKRTSVKAKGLLGLEPDRRFRFRGMENPADMARMAAFGLLPGVSGTVLRLPSRSPVVLSARHTRIAVGRDVAAAFIIEEEA